MAARLAIVKSAAILESMPRLFSITMADGTTRHLGDLPETYDVERPQWHLLRDAVGHLGGATLTGFVTDDVTEAWIDFEYRCHRFSMNNQMGWWWFFVADPACPDPILEQVLDHFEQWLDPAASRARRAGPMVRGTFRVVVIEADARVACADHSDAAAARAHADDAASEAENGIVISYVVDDELRVVHRGKHYAG
jgi:hypothetical protein